MKSSNVILAGGGFWALEWCCCDVLGWNLSSQRDVSFLTQKPSKTSPFIGPSCRGSQVFAPWGRAKGLVFEFFRSGRIKECKSYEPFALNSACILRWQYDIPHIWSCSSLDQLLSEEVRNCLATQPSAGLKWWFRGYRGIGCLHILPPKFFHRDDDPPSHGRSPGSSWRYQGKTHVMKSLWKACNGTWFKHVQGLLEVIIADSWNIESSILW